MTQQELIDNFAMMDQWEDRYRYIIDLGKKLPSLAPEFRTRENKVHGCSSQVWMVHNQEDNKHFFQADSDAFIVKGLASILITLYSGKTLDEMKAIDIESFFNTIGLSEHLSPTRRNGFFAMTQKLHTLASS